ncbi:ParA family protein [Rugamonas sp. CCM 8940]|uniref:ParA family protein n=1 Tax=Rugamonas sp. CCM 8940 TaxID=2765359 RepID=UPI0018F4E26E|nr:AAA family ATPase [Rugamonas sp. CCM 8940]MBJ7309924.1 AAA family ATPase [Rugamonas sp. CCM 8940]
MKAIRFNEALRLAAEAAVSASLGQQHKVLLIRDVYGRLRFAVNIERQDFDLAVAQKLDQAQKRLGAFSATGGVLFRDDFAAPDTLFDHVDWHETLVPGLLLEDGSVSPEFSIQLLDRQIVGQYWLRTEPEDTGYIHPPRVVFYGIKGGVGRSTALAMLAYRLARNGKRVLLLDFDLESPGLSGLLLPAERVATYGLVDWFVEDAVGQGDEILRDLIADSPLADNLTGSIRIAPAMGQGESAYLAKLARVYADVPHAGAVPEQFAARIQRLVRLLEVQEVPDIVLIDSRAGLHDLAAISITGLASLALLFATDTTQNWEGYRQLFGHWQGRPEVLRHVRSRLAIVQALFPESDQAERATRFRQNACDLFSTTLYDQIPAGEPTPLDAFTFGLDDEDAPHYPWQVRWSARLQEFDPLLPVERGGVGDADIDAAFGPFFKEVTSMVLGDS